MISVQRLHKSYGSVAAVRDVSFEVGAHEVVGFLGPNGAGKSTTLRIIAGFLGATSGKVLVSGLDIVEQPLQARGCIGYMPENVPLYPELRVSEYLTYRAELKGVRRAERKEAVQTAMRQVQIDDHAEVIIGQLSKGYRQRLGLADALVARPPVLVLDEPTAGMDPNQIREVRTLIRSLAKDHTVLLSTHILSEVEATCDRALVINKGQLVAQGSLEELRTSRRSSSAQLSVRGDSVSVQSLVKAFKDVASVKPLHPDTDSGLLDLSVHWKDSATDTSQALEELVTELVKAGFGVREAAPSKATLEDVFALLTVEEAAPQEGAS